jgi:hypothetical protein
MNLTLVAFVSGVGVGIALMRLWRHIALKRDRARRRKVWADLLGPDWDKED